MSLDRPAAAHSPLPTDDRGRFRLSDLPAADVWLAAADAGGIVALASPAAVAPGESREVELMLAPAARIPGRTVFPDGTRAPGIRLEAVVLEDFAHASAVSDDQGASP